MIHVDTPKTDALVHSCDAGWPLAVRFLRQAGRMSVIGRLSERRDAREEQRIERVAVMRRTNVAPSEEDLREEKPVEEVRWIDGLDHLIGISSGDLCAWAAFLTWAEKLTAPELEELFAALDHDDLCRRAFLSANDAYNKKLRRPASNPPPASPIAN